MHYWIANYFLRLIRSNQRYIDTTRGVSRSDYYHKYHSYLGIVSSGPQRAEIVEVLAPTSDCCLTTFRIGVIV